MRVGERRRETMAGDGGRSKGDEDRRIYAKQRVKIWRVAVDELKRLVKEEDGDVYAVHGGRITARMVDQLGDGAVIQFVDRMLGGGKKKMMKVEQGDQGATDKSSTEEDAVFEVFDRCSRMGIGGWSAEMTEAMLGMGDEQTERMLRM